MITRKYQREYPWIKYGDHKTERFDLELEGMGKKDIINKILDAIQGEYLKDKYGNTIALRTWTDKIRFYSSIKSNKMYVDYIKHFLGERLYKILINIIDQYLDKFMLTGPAYEDELIPE